MSPVAFALLLAGGVMLWAVLSGHGPALFAAITGINSDRWSGGPMPSGAW